MAQHYSSPKRANDEHALPDAQARNDAAETLEHMTILAQLPIHDGYRCTNGHFQRPALIVRDLMSTQAVNDETRAWVAFNAGRFDDARAIAYMLIEVLRPMSERYGR